jgi:hypothetical protein|tara:strand:- start:3434 stop:4240 length:807 start_codon:yes stop_codon:yes gene_type:complete
MLTDQALPGSGLNGDHRVFSSFFSDNNIVQQVAVVQPKNLLIDGLRNTFKSDSIFTYRSDEYGFPLTPDLTGKTIDSVETTKILISDMYRYEVKFFPAIVVKSNGGSYKPISFNQNGTIKYRTDEVTNAYGAKSIVSTPTHKVYAGAWDLAFDVQIYSESHSELEELVDIVSMSLQYSLWNELRANGLFIKGMNISGENAEPYANDYVYNQTITIQSRSEWRVEIPIDNIVEKIVFRFDSVRHAIPGVTTDADVLQLKYDDIIELTQL